MTGPGRWVLLEGPEALHGVLWTDEVDALGIAPVDGVDPDALALLLGGVAQCSEAGVAVLEVYTKLARSYDPETEYRGNLEDLAREL